MISRICSWAPNRKPPLRLCIGAPSSPLLSNSILYDFDCLIDTVATQDRVVYTRYADDLTFSSFTPDVLKRYPDVVKNICASLAYPSLVLNTKKTVFASRAELRMVTGVTLTPDHFLSVGRERKRLARAMFNRFTLDLLNVKEIEKMRGLLSFIDHIEPGFSLRLKSKKATPENDT
jgi:RNA-directed DNA polymerase